MSKRFSSQPPLPDESVPSKSEQKRAMSRLQDVGEALAALPESRIKRLPAGETLIDAILELKRMQGHEAVRRHKQYIGKLMRAEDLSALMAALEHRDARLKRVVDQWQERLLKQGDLAIQEMTRQFPEANRHTLRQYVRACLSAREAGENDELCVSRLRNHLNEILFLHQQS